MKFNKGDKVICSSATTGLKKGKQYEVIEFVESNVVGSCLISIIDETGSKFYYSSKRFITLEQRKEKLKKMLDSKMVFNYNKLLDDSFYW